MKKNIFICRFKRIDIENLKIKKINSRNEDKNE